MQEPAGQEGEGYLIGGWTRGLIVCASVSLCVTAAGVVGALVLVRQPVFADGFTPSQERIWQKSQSLRPKPSTDTTPVTIKVAAVTYRIPRNYLIFMGEVPILKVTWPGLRPLTEKTRKCFGSILQSRLVGCTSIKFILHGSGGPVLNNVEALQNLLKSRKPTVKRQGPFGYTVYETGPKGARIETYAKPIGASSMILFDCLMSQGDSSKHAICNDWFKLNDNNWIHFVLRYSQRMSTAEIEAGMRTLMESFRVKGGT